MTSSTTPMGNTTSYTYDSVGNQTSATDPLAHTTTYLHDAAGQIVGIINKDGTETSTTYYVYSDKARLSVVIQGTEQRTKSGDYEDALDDFNKIPLSGEKDIDTKWGKGRTGKLSNGKNVTVRPGSSEGSPTLQIPEGASRQIEIRYK